MKTKIVIEIETEYFRNLYENEEYKNVSFSEKDFHDLIMQYIERRLDVDDLTEYFADWDALPEDWDSIKQFGKVYIKLNNKKMVK